MKIVRNPEFKAAVKVLVPSEDGQAEEQFTGRFRALTVSEVNEYDFRSSESTSSFLRHVFLGWEADLRDESGGLFEVTAENISYLIDLPYIRFALQRAYFDAVSGLPGAKRGN